MYHADPWDESVRLQKQMEVELLAQFEAPKASDSKGGPPGAGAPVKKSEPKPPPAVRSC